MPRIGQAVAHAAALLLLAFSGGAQGAVVISTFTGGDEGEGLDLQGIFFAAVNMNASSSPIVVGDATFIDIDDATDTVSRSGLNGAYATSHAGFPNYGTNANDLALSSVMKTSRYQTGTITVAGLTVGSPYKLQLLFQTPPIDLPNNRYFDITLSGASSGFLDEFSMLNEGSFYNTGGISRGVVITHEFTALSSQLSIQFSAGSSGDTSPLLHALTVEQLVPEPGSLALISLGSFMLWLHRRQWNKRKRGTS